MSQPIYVVDAFTSTPFAGNPAGVCPLELPISDELMQSIATEMNHAETAFVRRRDDGDWDLRWFTPACEVDLCGHATLATAHILWTTGLAEGVLRFHTRSGVLVANRGENGIELDFPAEPAVAIPIDDLAREVLGGEPVWFGKNRMDYVAELSSEAAVRSFVPDFPKIRALGERCLLITAAADPDLGYDFVSRAFAPNFGIDEDPVTGSAHCCLGPYWSAKLNRPSLVGYQASKRGGFVGTEDRGDRVTLRGQAVTTLSGALSLHR